MNDKFIPNDSDINDVQEDSMDGFDNEPAQIDPENLRFPYCVVWRPLPLLSWVLPIIGHTGICT